MKKLLINLLLTGGAIFVSLVLGEFAARVYLRYQDHQIEAKNRENILTQVPKKELFVPANPGNFANRLNATVNWWGHRIQTDSLGCRTGIPAPDSAKTVLFIGDSMIFGLGLPDSSTIPALLQEEINRLNPSSPARVINAGVIGYDFQRYLYLLQRLGPIIRPRLVIVGLCYNDLAPNEDPFDDIMASVTPLDGTAAAPVNLASVRNPRRSNLSSIKGAIRSSSLYTLWNQVGWGSKSPKKSMTTSDPLKQVGQEKAPDLIDEFLRTAQELNLELAFVYFPVYQALGQDGELIYLKLLQERGCSVLDLSHAEDLGPESYFLRENRGHILPDIHFNLQGSRVVAAHIGRWLFDQ